MSFPEIFSYLLIMFASTWILIAGFIFLIFNIPLSFSIKLQTFSFLKLVCLELDKDYLEIKECCLKNIGSNIMTINLHMDIKNKSINNIKVMFDKTLQIKLYQKYA